VRLHPAGREWIEWGVDEAPAGDLEVSLDRGVTWRPLVRDGETVKLLVQGPDAADDPAPTAAPVTLPLGRTWVTIRAVANPQILVRDAGAIDIA